MPSRKPTNPSNHISLSGGMTAKPANGASASSVLMPVAADRGIAAVAARLVDILLAWHERRRQRRQLAMMDDHMLRDIGLSSADVEHEAHKPFWRM